MLVLGPETDGPRHADEMNGAVRAKMNARYSLILPCVLYGARQLDQLAENARPLTAGWLFPRRAPGWGRPLCRIAAADEPVGGTVDRHNRSAYGATAYPSMGWGGNRH
jgi:hypothetical protein